MPNSVYRKIGEKPDIHVISLPQKTDSAFADLIIDTKDLEYPHLQNRVLAHTLEHYLLGRILPNIKNETKISGVVKQGYIRLSITTKTKTFIDECKTVLSVIGAEKFGDEQTFQYEKESIINETASVLNRPDSLVYDSVAKRIFMSPQCRYAIQLPDELIKTKKVSLIDIKKYFDGIKTEDRVSLFIGIHQPSSQLEKKIKDLFNNIALGADGRTRRSAVDKNEFRLTPKELQVYTSNKIRSANNASSAYVALVYEGYKLPAKIDRTNAAKHMVIGLLCRSIVGQYSNQTYSELRREGIYTSHFLRQTFPEIGLIVFWSHVPINKIHSYVVATKNTILKPARELLPEDLLNRLKKKFLAETKAEWKNNYYRYEFTTNILLEEETGYSDLKSLLHLADKINPETVENVHKEIFYKQKPRVVVISDAKLPSNATKEIKSLLNNWFGNNKHTK